MLRAHLETLIADQVARLVQGGELPAAAGSIPVEVSHAKSPENGDYSTNFAMMAAKPCGTNPRALGERLAAALATDPRLAKVEVAGPGFLNLFLQPSVIQQLVAEVRTAGDAYGNAATPTGERINVEFVSVNPNGPITIGSGRGAAFGSVLCNVLTAAGNEVHREYYVNDGVNSEQMRLFAESVRAIAQGEPVPDNGYKGEYVHEVARDLIHRLSEPQITAEIDAAEARAAAAEGLVRVAFAKEARVLRHLQSLGHDGAAIIAQAETADLQFALVSQMQALQSGALHAFGTDFDTWFSEQALHDDGQVERRISELTASGAADARPFRTQLKLGKNGVIQEVLREEQAADEDDVAGSQPTLWLRSTKFGDDMDRVLRRRDGRLTYIASDVAYHADKFNRPVNGTRLITILGPDHHGYIGRLRAVLAALYLAEATPENDPSELTETEAELYESIAERNRARAALALAKERLEVVIYQLVRFLKDGKPAPMRKRDGNIYELRDLIRELGQRAAPDGSEAEQTRIGRDVARFFYLMRSHDTAMDFDLDLAAQQSDDNPVFYAQYAHARICSVLRKAAEEGLHPRHEALDRLNHERELTLIKRVLDLPWEIQRVARDYEVHRLTTYAVELARAYHAFYDVCRVIQPDQPELTSARLALGDSVRIALARTFALLGISAPERM